MRVISTGNNYRIYDNSLKVYEQLPARVYKIDFHPMQGFYLTQIDDIVINEKVYGVHIDKVNKVLTSFKKFSRNLGVILSGDKGIGKSLFAKLLSVECIKNNYPVVLVNEYAPGIADYINSIQQEVMVIFDEFDKTFFSKKESGSAGDPQTEMLTLFDGLSQGKKLFTITCNRLDNLSDFLVNRPGRFHYHFRFEYPTDDMIREYLKDKLEEQYYSQIEKVVDFAQRVNLNYDCLRAIAFELNLGTDFETAILDLNILNLKRESFSMEVVFKDGTIASRRRGRTVELDMFSDTEESVELQTPDGITFDIYIIPRRAVYDTVRNGLRIDSQYCHINYDHVYDIDSEEQFEQFKKKEVDCIMLYRQLGNNLRYKI